MCRVVDLLNNPIAFSTSSLPSPSLLLKLPTDYATQGYNNRTTAQLVRMDKQLLFLFLLYSHYTIKRPLTYVIANIPECVVVCKASHKNVSSVFRLADCTLEKQLSTQEN